LGEGNARASPLRWVTLDDFAEFAIEPDRIIAVNSGNQVRALSKISLVLFAPLHPLMILIG